MPMADTKLFFANIMVSSMVLFLGSRSLILTVAQDDPQILEVGHGCSPESYRYVNESAFQDNLDTAFKSLASNISSSNVSFFATSVSNKSDTDEVYALLLCRKYLTSQECLQCFTAAEMRLKQLCSNKGFNGGRIYMDGCLLRYENNTGFFEEATDGGFYSYCASSFATQPQEFKETAQILFSQLTTNASRSDGYGSGVASIASSFVYGVAQCAPTLSMANCKECLTAAQMLLVNNCLPMKEGRGLESGCFMRYANYSFDHNIKNFTTTSSNKNFKTWPILLGSIGGAALMVALCSFFFYRRFFDSLKRICFREGDFTAAETFDQLVVFDYNVLRHATANFNNTNFLGKGGFGEVYKGRLVDGREIAVKKLIETLQSKVMQDFLTEVKLISSVRHRNLVRLLGCCAQGNERLLVYEFMSNTSLDKHLFGDTSNYLDWETRFNIIVGTGRGLAYLHEDSNTRIVHRDIKAANILLDDKFHPKIADFGLAKFFPEGETHLSTRIAGTIGYTAPEYAVHGQLSEKADVYSYGVLVLEIISGRKCVNQNLPVPLQILLEWAWKQYERDEALEIVDARIREREYPREQVLRVINIAFLCCQASPVTRPTMSGVVSMLTRAWEIEDRRTQPPLIDTGVSTRRPSSWAAAASTSSDAAQSHGSITVSLIPR